jgi:cytoskeleton protein RodZ
MTLGEKLRHAREERGITLSEVAEQTRISPIYLEAIDHDDYRNLPGGIFNRGFVKSYAKYVGVDEQEALLDYARLQNELEAAPVENIRAYRPEVLTDDRSGSSMTPTIIMAAVILAVMTIGLLFLVSYLRKPAEPAANVVVSTNTNSEPISQDGGPATHDVPELASSTIELKALSRPVPVIVAVDGEPPKQTTIAAGSTSTFSPKESLTLNYLRWNASAVQLAINGKTISLPSEPLEPKDRDRIIFTISKDNLAQIWNSGSISQNGAPTADANADAAPQNTPSQPHSTPAAKAPPRANVAQTPRPVEPPKTNNAVKPVPANKLPR